MQSEQIQILINKLHTNSLESQNIAISEILESITKDTSILNLDLFQKHLIELIDIFEKLRGENKMKLADILSFLTITDKRTIEYKLKGGIIPIKIFGFQYAKDLLKCSLNNKMYYENIFIESINVLFENNSEIEAIDFLFEFNKKEMIKDFINIENYKKIVLYLKELNLYINLENLLYQIYCKFNKTIDKIIFLINHANLKCKIIDEEINEELKKIFNESTEIEKITNFTYFF